MPVETEVRRLRTKWDSGSGWPKKLEWIEINGLRGWHQQRFRMTFPMMAVVGENGSGKSTILQCAASIYRPEEPETKVRYASEFFPDTPWESIKQAEIRYSVIEGGLHREGKINKPGDRWRENPKRRARNTVYIDLSRIQPIPARVGYLKIANPQNPILSSSEFEVSRLSRLARIMGRAYEGARMSLTKVSAKRKMPVITHQGAAYSGFHQGAGETTIAELLQTDLPAHSLVLIDEIETSLHPRAQRRLVRDLAEKCRELQLQVIFTTHSPYVLDELPLEARAYIIQDLAGEREIVYGVTPEFAMSKMDDVPHYECDLYVEDNRAGTLVLEILSAHAQVVGQRCRIIPFGGVQVGRALGQMIADNRFPRPSCVFLDGDQDAARGCVLIPGGDSPERVVFESLRASNWHRLSERLARQFGEVSEACVNAMMNPDHHAWVYDAATRLRLSGDALWQVLCSEWAMKCLSPDDAKAVFSPIEDAIQAKTGAAIFSSTAPAPQIVQSTLFSPG